MLYVAEDTQAEATEGQQLEGSRQECCHCHHCSLAVDDRHVSQPSSEGSILVEKSRRDGMCLLTSLLCSSAAIALALLSITSGTATIRAAVSTGLVWVDWVRRQCWPQVYIFGQFNLGLFSVWICFHPGSVDHC